MPETKTHHYAGGVKTLYKKSPFRYNRVVQALLQERKGDFIAKKNNDLAHTKWMCKYHIVFAPKYRRKIFYGEKRAEIGKILRELCGWKGVTIIEAEVCPDHIHMLVEIPPKMSVSSFMGFLKGKSSLLIHERHANLKYKHGNRSFWCRGY